MPIRFSPRYLNPLFRLMAQFLFAALAILFATFVLVLLRHLLSVSVVALLFFLPIGLSSMLWGLAPGVFTSVLAFLSLNYFFIPPYYSFRVHQTQDLLALFVFLVVAVVINQLMGRARKPEDHAKILRKLAGIKDPPKKVEEKKKPEKGKKKGEASAAPDASVPADSGKGKSAPPPAAVAGKGKPAGKVPAPAPASAAKGKTKTKRGKK